MRKLFLILFIISLFSCEKQTNWTTDKTDFNTIVVEAIITNENKNQEVKLSKPRNDINEEILPVSNALVKVYDDDSVYYFSEKDTEHGTYLSNNKFIAVVGKTYFLEINYDNKIYISRTNMIPVKPFFRLIYSKVDSLSNNYKIAWVAKTYDLNEQAMYEVEIDWSHISNNSDTIKKAKVFYYTLNTIDVSQAFSPELENVQFPKGSIIIEKKYSLTDDYADYIRSMLAETRWRGGFFDEAQGNLITNIDNGGFGYFSACSVITRTIVVE
ncbi:MAG: DUF4249 domain-containing protein [Bacteroidales bacterium]|nr:DUF4249 domain-containing protein [Bacteroidales bacterium]